MFHSTREMENILHGNVFGDNNIAIGYNAIAIGRSVKYEESHDIEIGNVKATKIRIGPVDLIELQDNVKHLTETVKILQEENEKMREIINQLWYAPGMPGASEAREMFKNDLENLDKTKNQFRANGGK